MNNKPHELFIFASGLIMILGLFVIANEAQQRQNQSSQAAGMTSRFPGDPNPKATGKAYWGAGIDGNGDPIVRHERPSGKSLSIRRTFWQWSDHDAVPNDSIFTTVKADHAANRLPFVSTKTPPWQEVANGQHDARIDQLLRQLDSYGKPVWLSFHHEPEGGSGVNSPDDPGGAAAWRGMQSKVRERMNALGTKNIAFMPVLMAYTWLPGSGRSPDEWWVPGIWDAYIVDHYRENETGDIQDAGGWKQFVAWAEARNIPFGTGEWGNRGNDAQAALEMLNYWEWGFQNKKDMIAHTYFDSGLNSPNGSWALTGEPLTKFQSILGSDARVMRINELSNTIPISPTVVQGSTRLSIEVALHGIGKGGDKVNPTSQSPITPIRLQRQVTIDIVNTQNVVILTKQGTVTYDATSGIFKGTIDMGNTLSSGSYTIRMKTNQFLRGMVPSLQTITAGKEHKLAKVTLGTGDINNDNSISITDFNILMSCYSDLRASANCSSGNKLNADLSDDGSVNAIDYNIFIRAISNQGGI